MAKINLTDEEKMQIIEAINQDTEPSSDLMAKLFPKLAEKFDVAKLDRAKIATLEYSGKRSEAIILSQTLLTEGGSPLQVERCFAGGKLTKQTQLDLFEQSKINDNEWRNLIVQGDNLQFLKTCYQNTDPLIKDKVKGKVKLVYIDPPFATKSDFQTREGHYSYSDKIVSAEFLESMRERLIYLKNIMAEDATIYLHVDFRKAHFIKVIMDELFGAHDFAEIVWICGLMGSGKFFPKAHETIFCYKNKSAYFDPPHRLGYSPRITNALIKDENGWYYTRGRESSGGSSFLKTYICNNPDLTKEEAIDEANRNKPQTAWGVWIGKEKLAKEFNDFPMGTYAYTEAEKLGYPTQKPELLLERIINASSKEGDLVLDIFAGSGTTAAIAEKLGRRWIVCDFGKHAIYTVQKRILRIAESKSLWKDIKKKQKYGKSPKPFCVISCGAYDFSRIMNLRENKEAYINFVLGLFQLSRDQKDLNGKYKLTNIYGEKDGDPVEVYPVWEDEYLKEVRIDENYLRETIIQGGGKLKGNYYIITPETCTVVSDTTMKNSIGDEVYFKLLKFPYKILEDVSRNFQVHDQPNSQNNVNKLINSTGFYFNNDVELELEKTDDGLKITKFTTRILDKEGNYYKGFDGLAMILIDIDYNGKLFDMEKTVFAKDLGENVGVKVAGLTDCIAVIAIDKHGNESKPFIIKD